MEILKLFKSLRLFFYLINVIYTCLDFNDEYKEKVSELKLEIGNKLNTMEQIF